MKLNFNKLLNAQRAPGKIYNWRTDRAYE